MKLQNGEMGEWWLSPHIIRVIIRRRGRCVGYVARLEEKRNWYNTLADKLEGNRLLGRETRKWENNINPFTPNDHDSGRTAPLTSKYCILYIYSTNIGTEYFEHGKYCPFFFSSSKWSLFHNSNVFGSCIIHILYTGCAKIKKKIIPAPKG